MSTIDWRDPARRDEVRFQMVDPNNLDNVYGDLTDVQLGSSSITYGYFADTRYSSGISFLKSSNYVENAWVRIIHDVPAAGYSNELGTFIPTSPVETRQGSIIVELDLQSPLWGLKDDLLTSKLSIGKKSSMLSAISKVCTNHHRPYLFENPNDIISDNSIVYDVGESALSVLHDLCNQSGNRLDLDGHGRIVIAPVIDSSSLTPTYTLDYDDPRSMIIEDSVKMESQIADIPSRAIVVNGDTVGYADLNDGVPYSAAQRGYVLASKYEDKSATTQAKAEAIAARNLRSFSTSTIWSMDCLYFPCKCGDNITFVYEGKKHVCMVQSIDPLDLDTMTMGLTLREINVGQY